MPDGVPIPAQSVTSIRVSTVHGPIGVGAYYAVYFAALAIPMFAGVLLYGWRAAGCVAVAVFGAMAAGHVWSRIGERGRLLRPLPCLYLGLLIGMMLPAHLLSSQRIEGVILWPILLAGGATAVMLSWALQCLPGVRLPCAVVTILLLTWLFGPALTPRAVLRRDRLFSGDVLRVDPGPTSVTDSWTVASTARAGSEDAILRPSPAASLSAYMAGRDSSSRSALTAQALISVELPPLEDVIYAGQSAPIGLASGAAVLVGGLMLIYWGRADPRVPALAISSAMAALAILPIPMIAGAPASQWLWLPWRAHALGWATGVTLMNYEIFASPLLLTVFFLAAEPGLSPMTRRGRMAWAVFLGVASAAAQLYGSASVGPYAALAVVCLFTPMVNRLFPPRTLV